MVGIAEVVRLKDWPVVVLGMVGGSGDTRILRRQRLAGLRRSGDAIGIEQAANPLAGGKAVQIRRPRADRDVVVDHISLGVPLDDRDVFAKQLVELWLAVRGLGDDEPLVAAGLRMLGIDIVMTARTMLLEEARA